MGTKHKALVLLALLLLIGIAVGACSGKVAKDPPVASASMDDPEDEVLESDQDEFGRTDFSRADNKVGGFIVSVGYLGMIVGSTILPLLLL